MNTNSDYYSALAQIEALIEKGFENLTVEETKLLSILSEEVEKFEATKYPMPLYSSITGLLESIMMEKRLNKSQLSNLLGVPNSTLSEIMNGKRRINLKIARKMHDKLKIDGNLIFDSL